jgi:hypothetical protein
MVRFTCVSEQLVSTLGHVTLRLIGRSPTLTVLVEHRPLQPNARLRIRHTGILVTLARASLG